MPSTLAGPSEDAGLSGREASMLLRLDEDRLLIRDSRLGDASISFLDSGPVVELDLTLLAFDFEVFFGVLEEADEAFS